VAGSGEEGENGLGAEIVIIPALGLRGRNPGPSSAKLHNGEYRGLGSGLGFGHKAADRGVTRTTKVLARSVRQAPGGNIFQEERGLATVASE
jgi:hypothetical protein